jgi:hypothetical protein
MSMINAPDGAIFALLAIVNAAPIVPDEDAELWLREQFLIEDSPGGVTALTSRGAAFVRILYSTPLPVKVERWDDPREQPAPPPPAATPFDAKAFADVIAAALAGAVRPASLAAAPVARPAPPGARDPEIVTSIPPGYILVPEHFKTIPPGQWPAELAPDADVKVIYRDGRVSVPRAAQSIIWLHKDHPDDVMAYMQMGNDTMIRLG